MRLSGIIILAVALITGALAASAFAQGGPYGDVLLDYDFAPTHVVIVPANAPWTETGISLAAGDRVSIIAKGLATTVLAGNHSVFTGPEGLVEPHNPSHPAPNAAQWSLIGRVGPNGLPFPVGGAITIQALVSGDLYLGFNDLVFGDNVGEFVAYVTIPVNYPIPISAVAGQEPNPAELGSSFPNPFNRATQINFDLAYASKVRVDVLDVQGRLVATLLDEDRPVGPHSVTWNGMNESGSPATSGTYYYRIQSGDGVVVNKVVLTK